MSNATENLQNLLKLVKDLSSRDELEWFRKELVDYFSSTVSPNRIEELSLNNNPKYNFSDFPSFLRFQKKHLRAKGKTFYINIKEHELRNQLIKDYVEMNWFLSMNDIDRFMLFTFYQFENLLNHYCIESNCFEKIRKNKNYFIQSFNENFTIICSDNFLNKKTNQPNPIEKINIWPKLVYWSKDSRNEKWESENHSNISSLINIRNKNSHRTPEYSNEYVLQTISYLSKQDISKFSFFTNILSQIIKSLKNINPTSVEIEIKNEKTSLKGLKQVGFIDPKTFKK